MLGDELVDAELESNMAGRAGRTGVGQVCYLYEIDDSTEALAARRERRGGKKGGTPMILPYHLLGRRSGRNSIHRAGSAQNCGHTP